MCSDDPLCRQTGSSNLSQSVCTLPNSHPPPLTSFSQSYLTSHHPAPLPPFPLWIYSCCFTFMNSLEYSAARCIVETTCPLKNSDLHQGQSQSSGLTNTGSLLSCLVLEGLFPRAPIRPQAKIRGPPAERQGDI